MKWEFKDPSPGDMIRVSTGGIYHFGIYVSDSEVIQFGLPPTSRAHLRDSEVEVLSSDIDAFLAGGFLEVCSFDKKEKKKNRKADEIVAYARSKIGTRGYHILYNNCEHFANECVNGEQVCRQAEELRALFRKIPVVDVYIATVPEGRELLPLAPVQRWEEIEAVSNERVRCEKYFVWKLLLYALDRSFGMRGDKLKFRKESFGGWSVDGAEISLSHSDGVVAVAVSRARVGIDVERVHTPRSEKIAKRILTEKELTLFLSLPEEEKEARLIEAWTVKEALFKSEKRDAFIPRDYDTVGAVCKSGEFYRDGEKYIWTVATETPERVKIFTNIELK